MNIKRNMPKGNHNYFPTPIILLMMAAFSLASCSWINGPEYQRPLDAPMKQGWTNASNKQLTAEDVIRPDWWTGFADPYLDKLIEQAVAANYNLKILVARLKEAGIQVGAEKTQLLPRIVGDTGVRTDRTISDPGTNTTATNSRFNVQVDWELDIWGKIRTGVEATKASYKATEAEWRGGYLKLVSDVATKYFLIRQFDQQIATQQRSLEQNIAITNIYRYQMAEGIVSATKVMKQEAEINRTRKDLLDLQRSRKVEENGLSTLLGIPAGEFQVPVGSLLETTQVPVVPAGLPSDLLARRPDLIAAEYQLLRAYRLLEKSKLELLPKLSMTASGGLANQVISSAVKSYTFGMGPTVSFPIFDPAAWKKVDSSEASQETAAAQYRDKIMQAFAEVENALINVHSRKQQQVQLRSQVAKLIIVKDSVIERLKEGLVSQLDVLEAERSLVSSELALLNIHQQILSDTVTLYKAMGGGWPKEIISSETELIINEH